MSPPLSRWSYNPSIWSFIIIYHHHQASYCHQWEPCLTISPFVIGWQCFSSLPLWHQWQWGANVLPLSCCSPYHAVSLEMLLDLMWWKSNDSHILAKILKCSSWKGFCKDISNFIFCIEVFQLDILFSSLFTEKMVFDWNMFGLWVHH